MFFEQSISYYEKYLSKLKEASFGKKSLESLRKQKNISLDYIKNINSGAIVLIEKSLSNDRILDGTTHEFISLGTGFTANLNLLGISLNDTVILYNNFFLFLKYLEIQMFIII